MSKRSTAEQLANCELEIARCWKAAFEDSAYGVIGFEDWRKEREMIMEEFVKDALRTEPSWDDYVTSAYRITPCWNSTGFPSGKGARKDSDTMRLLHVGMGLATEAGEFTDALKRHIFYGKELDKTNLIEELGDITWYLRIACDVLGVPLAEVIQKNVDKLRARFPEKFTEDAAVNRDLGKERAALDAEGAKHADAINNTLVESIAAKVDNAWARVDDDMRRVNDCVRSHTAEEKVIFASGATGSKVPHLEYIPYAAIVSMARRFELGTEKHGPGAWNATQNNHFLSDKEWAVARCVHTIIHAYKEIGIISGYAEDDGDDNAGAILFGGAFLAARREWLARERR